MLSTGVHVALTVVSSNVALAWELSAGLIWYTVNVRSAMVAVPPVVCQRTSMASAAPTDVKRTCNPTGK